MLPNNITSDRERTVKQQQAKSSEENLDTDLYSGGFFDGLIGLEPSSPEKFSYWSGYQIGNREYCAAKLSVEIPTQF